VATGGMTEDAAAAEIAAMRELFKGMDDALISWAEGTKDQMMDPAEPMDGAGGKREELIKRWGDRWLRVFRRRSAIEEAHLVAAAKQ